MRITFFLCIVLILFEACSINVQGEKGVSLARVGEKMLYQSDLNSVMPLGLTRIDSLQFAEDYINTWVKKQLLLQKAEENLSNEQKDFSKELEEYRTSLLLYAYKKALVAEKMDTVVSCSEIDDFYNTQSANFILKRNIVKVVYLKLPREVVRREKIKTLCLSVDGDYSELESFALQYAKRFDLFNHQWVYFDEVLQKTPFEITDQTRQLRQNKFIEREDNEYLYILFIKDFRLRDEISPIEFVEERIKSLILNKRKMSFMKQLENDVYRDGLKHRKFKIFNQ